MIKLYCQFCGKYCAYHKMYIAKGSTYEISVTCALCSKEHYEPHPEVERLNPFEERNIMDFLMGFRKGGSN